MHKPLEEIPKMFRVLLMDLVNSNRSAILIGENHDTSPTTEALVANLDILKSSKRKIIIVTEGLDEAMNPQLESALKNKDFSYLKEAGFSKSTRLSTFELCKIMLEAGIPIYGSESEQYEKIDDPYKYAISKERIKNANTEFARVVKKFISDSTLVIFISGSAHNIALLDSNNTIVDSGIIGRVENSVTLRLVRSTDNLVTANDHYRYEDNREFHGIYDFCVNTNIQNLFIDSFNSLTEPEDKLQLLLSYINNKIELFTIYKINTSSSSKFSLKEDKVLQAFNISTNSNCSFKHVHLLIDSIVKQSETKPSLLNLFGMFSRSDQYKKELLIAAVAEDIATEIPHFSTLEILKNSDIKKK